MSSKPDTLRVFLCHSVDDKPTVRELYKRLSAVGLDVWLDEVNLLPGQDWDLEIAKAVQSSHVVIICLSSLSVRKIGYVQTEIHRALDAAERQPEGSIFLIPLRLEECEVPQRLRRWQWVDFYRSDGSEKLLAAMRARSDDLGIPLLIVEQLLTSIRSAVERSAYEDIVAAVALVDLAVLPLEALREVAQVLTLTYSKFLSTSPIIITSLSKLVDCHTRLSTLLPGNIMVRLHEWIARLKYSQALFNAGRYHDVPDVLMSLLYLKSSPALQTQSRLLIMAAQVLFAAALEHLERYQDVITIVDQNLEDSLTDPIFLSCWVLFSVLKAESLKSLGDIATSEIITEQICERCRSSSDPVKAAEALQESIDYLRGIHRYKSAIPLLECSIAIVGGGGTRRLRELDATSNYKLAECRRRTEDYEGAIVTCNDFLAQFTVCENPVIESAVAWGMTELERSLRKVGRFQEAANVSQQVLDRFNDSTQEQTNSAVAWAYAEKGAALEGLEEYQEAVTAYTAFLEHFDGVNLKTPDRKNHDVSLQVSWALGEKARCLSELGNHETAVAICEEVIERFKETCSLDVQFEVAWCMVHKASNLRKSGRNKDAAIVYQSVIHKFGSQRRADFREEIRSAISGLRELGEYETAVVACNEVIELFEDSASPDSQFQVAWCMVEKASDLQKSGLTEDAATTYQSAIRTFGTELRNDFRKEIRIAINELGELGHYDEVVAICDEIIARFKGMGSLDARFEVAWCMVEKAYNFRKSGRLKDAVTVYQSVISTFINEIHDDFRNEIRAAIQGVGVCRLYQAKQALCKGDKKRATSLLTEAEHRLLEAIKMTRKAGAIGSLGYIAFLRGDFEATRSLLAEAYALEGEDWRREELNGICMFALAQDQTFVEMLESLTIMNGQ